MSVFTKEQIAEELAAAKVRARDLAQRGYSKDRASKLMAGEFQICVYATQTGLWASHVEKEGREVYTNLMKHWR